MVRFFATRSNRAVAADSPAGQGPYSNIWVTWVHAGPVESTSGSTTTAETTAACGYSDTLRLGTAGGDTADTCRYRSGLGTLHQYASTVDWGRIDMYHYTSFANHSGRDIHLGFYRQGIRGGERINTQLVYNLSIPRGETRHVDRVFSRYHYSNVRFFVKHHATGRTVYTPWINMEQCTGPGGQC